MSSTLGQKVRVRGGALAQSQFGRSGDENLTVGANADNPVTLNTSARNDAALTLAAGIVTVPTDGHGRFTIEGGIAISDPNLGVAGERWHAGVTRNDATLFGSDTMVTFGRAEVVGAGSWGLFTITFPHGGVYLDDGDELRIVVRNPAYLQGLTPWVDSDGFGYYAGVGVGAWLIATRLDNA